MSEKVKTQIVLLEPCSGAVQDLLSQVVQKGQAEPVVVKSPEEAVQTLMQFLPCMLLCSVTDNEQIARIVGMLKKAEKPIKSGTLKTMVVSKVKNRQLANLITGLGVTDYIEEPAPIRTMLFKANLQLKAIETVRKQEEMKKASQEKIVFKKSEQKKEEEAGSVASTAKQKPALTLSEDTFLFKNSQAKKIGKKTVLEMEGPAPETGEWQQQEDKGDAQTAWRWVPKEEKDKPKSKEESGDGWVHKGDKPQFDAESGKWKMASEKPELALVKNGKKVAEKVSTDESGEVSVAADSPAAEANLQRNKKLAEIAKTKDPEARAKAIKALEKEDQEATKLKGAAPNPAGAEKEQENRKKPAGNPALEALAKLGKGAKTPKPDPEAEAKFNDKQSEGTDNVVELKDRREKGGDEDGERHDWRGEEIKQAAAEAPKKLSPLEFLQKKKKDEPGKAAPEKAEAKEEDSNKAAQAKPALEKKEKRASRAKDALERLKRSVGEEILPGEEIPEEAKAEEISSETPAGEAPEPRLKRAPEKIETEEKEAKAAGEKLAPAPPPKDPAGKPKTFADQQAQKEKKKALYREIQDVMRKPLPEKLTPEEEEEIRGQLNLKDRPEIGPKELAKRSRVAKVKELKARLADLDLPPEEQQQRAEQRIHDLSAEEKENTTSQKGAFTEAPKSKLRAFDSDLSDEEAEAEAKKKEKAKKQETAPAKPLRDDKAHFMPEADIQPLGGAWERAGAYYVYVQADTRYRGFESLDSLLPIWFFNGEKAPELLSKAKEWKFIGGKPEQATMEFEIPGDVKDYLLELKKNRKEEPTPAAPPPEEIKATEEEKAAEEAQAVEAARVAEEAAASALDEADQLIAAATAQVEAKAEEKKKKAAEAVQEAAKTQEKKKTEHKRNLDDLLAKAEDGLTAAEEPAPAEPEAETEEAKAEETATPPPVEKKKTKPDLEALLAKVEEGSDSILEEEKPAEPAAEKPQENAPDQAETLKEVFKKPEPEQALAPKAEREERDPAKAEQEGIAAKVTEKLASSSDAISKFLERRKSKERPPETTKTPSPYLSIFVCASDVLGQPHLSLDKSVAKLLNSIAIAFPQCGVAVTALPGADGNASIRYAAGDGFTKNSQVSVDSPQSFPITKDGSGTEILGYLILKAGGERTSFSTSEIAAASKAATFVWALMTRPVQTKEKLAA